MKLSPIFIIGCERSGTSLLGAMLGTSAHHITTPECQFKRLFLPDGDPLEFHSREEARDLLKEVFAHFRFRIWGIPFDPEAFLDRHAPQDRRSMLEAIVREYAFRQHGKTSPRVWFDHDPRSGLYFEELLRLFPEARFIHIIRDGRGVYASVKELDWGPNTPLAAARFWVRHVEKAAHVEEVLGPEKTVRVFYEDLLEDPRKELMRICDRGGLDFNEEMLEGKGFLVPDYTRAQHRHVNSRPVSSKGQGWESRLSRREVEIFESHAKGKLEELGYGPHFSAPRLMGRLERFWYRKKEAFLKKRNKKRMEKRKRFGLQKAEG